MHGWALALALAPVVAWTQDGVPFAMMVVVWALALAKGVPLALSALPSLLAGLYLVASRYCHHNIDMADHVHVASLRNGLRLMTGHGNAGRSHQLSGAQDNNFGATPTDAGSWALALWAATVTLGHWRTKGLTDRGLSTRLAPGCCHCL